MKTAAVLLALSATAGLAYVGLAPEKKPVIQIPERPAPPATPAAAIPDLRPPVRPDLTPIRALALQPGGLPGQVTLTVANGLPSGLVLTAAAVGPYQGWVGYDVTRNYTHAVYNVGGSDLSEAWFYSISPGNGIPPNLPNGAPQTFRLTRATPQQMPMRPVPQWFDPYWTPGPIAPTPVLPLVGGYAVSNNATPYGGAVVVQ